MNLKIHIVTSLVLAGACQLFGGDMRWAILILFGALFPDVDHYLYYRYKFGDWSFIRAYKWVIAESQKPHPGPFEFIFHTLEYAVIVGILALLLKPLIFVLLGSGVHIFLDITEDITHYHSYTRYYVLSLKKLFK
jgi:vacuolar-type H+-ATPase subunit I/STV1